MPKYNPDFWEIPFDPQVLDQLEVKTFNEELSARTIPPEVISLLHTLIRTRLTNRQQRILEMYFFDGLNEQAIASQLGISQQVVSKHLFGVIRDGKKVGGAIRKLQKIMSGMDIDPKKWV
jgi:FixJ family two-component response regulator